MMSLELIPETVMCSAVQRTRIQNRMSVYARKRLKLIPVPCLPVVSLKLKCDAISHVMSFLKRDGQNGQIGQSVPSNAVLLD